LAEATRTPTGPRGPEAGAVRSIRCAIYTRKSTDEGLDQDFNSLDAQREAAEAFILSQRSEGLVALPERYDDGGFGGGNLERPALNRLLADIRTGAVDCVIVYKVDRLSRSLIDFARVIETFEKHNVSFVSVTQQFNTTNSLGRLTLNILLSFAQFEREIIAERTRDKLSAARRKGKWIGGRPMLGYDIDPRGPRLTVNADEAFYVRAIFKLYIEHNALLPVVREINRRGWRTKQWVTKQGVTNGGKPFTKSRLFRLLKNPIYIGKIAFKEQIYEGEHKAIVEAPAWERVQHILQRNGRNGGVGVRDGFGVLLRALLQCAFCGAGMIQTRRTKDSRRHRCYVCAQAQPRGRANFQTRPVSEPAIKAVVIRQIRRIGSDPRVVALVVATAEEQRRSTVADLTLECQVTQGVLVSLRGSTVPDLEERIGQMESRLAEIDQELWSLERETVDSDVAVALGQFWPVWQSLKCREQARIVKVLIKRIIYNGKTNKLAVKFHSPGIREVCRGFRRGRPR